MESHPVSHLTENTKMPLIKKTPSLKRHSLTSCVGIVVMMEPILRKKNHHGQSRTSGLVAWLCYLEPPPPTNLIAMGCSTRHTKDFIQIQKSAKKIINLFNFSPLPTRPPQNNRMQPPLHSPTFARPLLIIPHRYRVCLVGCHVVSLIGGPLKP